MFPTNPNAPKSRKRFSRLATALPVLGVAVALAACSSQANTSASGGSASNDSAKGISVVVIGSTSSDPFFSTVKNGVNDAAKVVESAGGKVDYLALTDTKNQGADTAKLLQTALNQHPSAVVFPDWIPSAEEPTAKQIVQAGIPVFVYNAGNMDAVKSIGAETFIGSDIALAGKAGGEKFVSSGVKDVVFVNTVTGDTSAEAVSNGYKDAVTSAGGKYQELNLPASSFGDPTAVTQAVKSELLNNPGIDGVATYGAVDADSAANAIQQAGATSKVKLIGFNLSQNTMDRIKAGTQLATIDQQPYAQGFYATIAAFQFAAYGIKLTSQPLLTGPFVIDASNVDKAISGTKLGVR